MGYEPFLIFFIILVCPVDFNLVAGSPLVGVTSSRLHKGALLPLLCW